MNNPSHPVSELIIKILGTNNGYLFAPTQNEIDFAKTHQSVFNVETAGFWPFPNKISLK